MAMAKKIINENLLGNLVAVAGSAMFFKPDDYFAVSPWRTQKGAGPILINLVHEIGNLRYLCGEITQVQAMASNVHRKFDVEDTATINLKFENGTLGSFIISDTAACARSWEQTSHENKAYAYYPDEDCYMVAGTDGSISIPTMRVKRYDNQNDRSWWIPFKEQTIDVVKQDPVELQLEHFCAVIRGEAEPIVSIHDGLQNLRVVDAITRAATSGETINL